MLVVDVSGSMIGATEFQPQQSGREVTIAAFNELINRRANIGFGLMIFSTDSYIARYFTYKNELFRGTLENKKEIDRIAQGTHAAEALKKARLFFSDNIEGEDKAIVLISDFNIDPKLALEMVEEIERDLLAGINLYLVTTGGEQIMVTIPQMSGLKIVDINDKYGIDKMYEELSAMQSTVIREKEGLLKETLIPFLILPALGIISLCLILSETHFRKIP
ncbi:VWA domain-containing protein [Chloroflexota bacterium]